MIMSFHTLMSWLGTNSRMSQSEQCLHTQDCAADGLGSCKGLSLSLSPCWSMNSTCLSAATSGVLICPVMSSQVLTGYSRWTRDASRSYPRNALPRNNGVAHMHVNACYSMTVDFLGKAGGGTCSRCRWTMAWSCTPGSHERAHSTHLRFYPHSTSCSGGGAGVATTV